MRPLRSWSPLLVVAALALPLAACTGGDEAGPTPPASGTGSTAGQNPTPAGACERVVRSSDEFASFVSFGEVATAPVEALEGEPWYYLPVTYTNPTDAPCLIHTRSEVRGDNGKLEQDHATLVLDPGQSAVADMFYLGTSFDFTGSGEGLAPVQQLTPGVGELVTDAVLADFYDADITVGALAGEAPDRYVPVTIKVNGLSAAAEGLGERGAGEFDTVAVRGYDASGKVVTGSTLAMPVLEPGVEVTVKVPLEKGSTLYKDPESMFVYDPLPWRFGDALEDAERFEVVALQSAFDDDL